MIKIRKPYSFGEGKKKENSTELGGKGRKPFSLNNKDTTRYRRKVSNKQESDWAKKTGGKTQIASGAFWHSKGDVREECEEILAGFCWENKYTAREFFRLSVDLWEEIREKAYGQGNIPGIHLQFTNTELDEDVKLVFVECEKFSEFIDGSTETFCRLEMEEKTYKSVRINPFKWREYEIEMYANDNTPILDVIIDHDDYDRINLIGISEEEFLMLR